MKRHATASKHAAGPAAFTLVELLVVVGIIAVLIGLLLPALARSQEQAKRVKCASNLRNWGQAAHMFAGEHKGMFPRAYRNKWTSTGYPTLLNGNDADYPAGNWRTLGTPWSVFKSYGLTDQVAVCPSSETQELGYANGDTDGNWAPLVSIGYMYMGQIDRETYGHSYHNWRTAPARKNKDPATSPLAADVVFRGGGAANGYIVAGGIHDDNVIINHIWRRPFMPDAQNVLYADGHVDIQTYGWYRPGADGKLEVSSSPHGGAGAGGDDWSFLHFYNGGLFYWEGSK